MGKEDRLLTSSPRQTAAFFRRFAQRLTGGQVVGLVGELGVGKTLAVSAILSAWGIRAGESPTFVMVRSYRLPRPHCRLRQIVHADAYRLETTADAITTGITDLVGRPDTLLLVEWADRVRDLLPPQTVWVTIEHRGGDRRAIRISDPTGRRPAGERSLHDRPGL
jgi:tRNA threonylcarbamoyladenosine biosynthesis protein TsaE